MKFEFAQCPLLALSGQSDRAHVCPLLDQSGQRGILARDDLSAYDPQRTLERLLAAIATMTIARRAPLDARQL